MPGVRRGYRMLCGAAGPPRSYWGLGRATGAVRGREAAAQQPESRRETLRGSSERSRPLHGLAALILRASAAFRALRQRRERSRSAAPPVSARIAAGAESP